MTFVFWAALALAGFVAGPIVAHLLRRGRAEEREFPGAALVPPLTSTARKRSRLEDWTLLLLRSAMIVGLAVLGASPLVRCDRLSLARSAGGSVALSIVLDDSLSMRGAPPGGRTRWDVARKGASELLRSARDGDSVALVLAGRPARVALAPTNDLAMARRALDELVPSDRATDLPAAVSLARTSLRGLPQKDQRVIVFSDLAGDPIPEGTPPAVAPLPELTEPVEDCGITAANREGGRVAILVACSSEAAARDREVEIVVAKSADGSAARPDGGAPPGRVGDRLAKVELPARKGEQTVALDVKAEGGTLDARLTGKDGCEEDDTAPISDESAARRVAVVADAQTATAKTGGPTVLEQAIDALDSGFTVLPLPLVPDDEKGLVGIFALIVDDPRGFSPEARTAIGHFVERGGIACALLGSRSITSGLGWTLEPFARGAARWEPSEGLGIETASVAWLGPEAGSLGGIGRKGRIRLDGMELEQSRVVGKWTDGVPWLLERRVGRGLIVTSGLPSSLEASDLAVRPGFLALLDHVIRQADLRQGSRKTTAGTTWTFPGVRRAVIEGPDGPLAVTEERNDEECDESEGCSATVLRATGALRGRYSAKLDGATETRVVTLEPAEILQQPRSGTSAVAAAPTGEAAYSNASREVALLLLLLLGAELSVRAFRSGVRGHAERAASRPRP